MLLSNKSNSNFCDCEPPQGVELPSPAINDNSVPCSKSSEKLPFSSPIQPCSLFNVSLPAPVTPISSKRSHSFPSPLDEVSPVIQVKKQRNAASSSFAKLPLLLSPQYASSPQKISCLKNDRPKSDAGTPLLSLSDTTPILVSNSSVLQKGINKNNINFSGCPDLTCSISSELASQKLTRTETRRLKRAANEETPRRQPQPQKKFRECDGDGTSSKPKLIKKFEKLQSYFDKHLACEESIRELNCSKNFGKNLPKDVVAEVAKSSMDQGCIGYPARKKEYAKQTKNIHSKLLNMLARIRYGKWFTSGYNETSFVKHCSMKDDCLNLYHRVYKEDTNREMSRKIGGYVFTLSSGLKWSCKNCKSLKKSVEYFHKCEIDGQKFEKLIYGNLCMNTTTDELEDPTQNGKKVNPESPGGIPHICWRKAEVDNLVKIQKTRGYILNAKKKIKRSYKRMEKEIDELVCDIDEKKASTSLKNFIQTYCRAFAFHKNHRRYFVYFITSVGSKDILYFGITYDPKRRLHSHKTGELFEYERIHGIDLEMHLMPLGNINSMLAVETMLIRLCNSKHLNHQIKNVRKGDYSSIKSFSKHILKHKSRPEFVALLSSLKELIQHTFDYGTMVSPSDGSGYRKSLTDGIKRRLVSHVKTLNLLLNTIPKKEEIVKPELVDPKKIPLELKAQLKKWKKIFEMSEIHPKHFLYFFTYANERDVIYYGITAEPDTRFYHHQWDSESSMYKIFRGSKKLNMYLVPLGDINAMLAGELETTFIRLSKAGHLKDGNAIVNKRNGYYSSKYSFTEKKIIVGTGKKFSRLVLIMNQLLDVTLAKEPFATNQK